VAAPENELTSGLETAAPVCTAANKPQLIAQMLTQPIKPPRYVAGLDLAGDDAWSGLSQSAVEQAYCAGIADGSDDSSAPNPLSYFIWGSDGNTYPVEAGFDASHKLGFVEINTPYTGTVEMRSRAGSRFGDHAYTLKVNGAISRDGQPFVIDWANPVNLDEAATELTDALVATFAPELPAVVSDCVQSKRCFLSISAPDEKNDGGGIIGARDISFYVHVPNQDVTASALGPSRSDYFYLFPKPAHLSFPEPPPANH
jgi:hypothetical protein